MVNFVRCFLRKLFLINFVALAWARLKAMLSCFIYFSWTCKNPIQSPCFNNHYPHSLILRTESQLSFLLVRIWLESAYNEKLNGREIEISLEKFKFRKLSSRSERKWMITTPKYSCYLANVFKTASNRFYGIFQFQFIDSDHGKNYFIKNIHILYNRLQAIFLQIKSN